MDALEAAKDCRRERDLDTVDALERDLFSPGPSGPPSSALAPSTTGALRGPPAVADRIATGEALGELLVEVATADAERPLADCHEGVREWERDRDASDDVSAGG